MGEKADGMEVTKNLILYLIAIWWNGILGFMYIADRANELGPPFWIVYAAFMSPLGINIAYKGFKTVRKVK